MKYTKLISGIIAAMCIGASVHAQIPVDMTVNGSYIQTNSQIYITDGCTMLPARLLSEVLEADSIEWDENKRKVTIIDGANKIEAYIGSKTAYINGRSTSMPAAAVIHNDKTYLGARFICESLGAEVDWNEKTHTVIIKKDGITVSEKHVDNSYTAHDLEWLAKIVHAEAEGEIHNGKVAVANVVLNRTQSREFPNSIYDVVFDKKYGVQFTPTVNGAIYNNPSKESYTAAKQALFGKNVAGNSLYFLNPTIAESFWIVNNRPFYMSIGNHDFYL